MGIEISSLVSLAKGAACLQRQILHRWSLQHNIPASSIPAVRWYSTQTAESKEEEPLHTIISNTENVKGGPDVLWGHAWGAPGSRCGAGEPSSAVLLPLEKCRYWSPHPFNLCCTFSSQNLAVEVRMAFTEKQGHQDCIHGLSQAVDGHVWRVHRHWNWLKRIFRILSQKQAVPARSLLWIMEV